MYVQENNEILKVKTVKTKNQDVIIKSFHCWDEKLVMVGENTTAVNVPLPIMVSFQDWQNNSLPIENTIKITVTGPGQPVELTLAPVNGQVEFDFESPIPGIFIIRATTDIPCDFCEMEVTVSE